MSGSKVPKVGIWWFALARIGAEVSAMRMQENFLIYDLILFSGNRQIPGLATGAVGHSLFYSRR